jgi:predicted RND superfamily exporter protein
MIRPLIRLAERSVERPWRSIFWMVAVTLAAVPGLFRLQIRTDGHALMPSDHPVVRFDAEVRKRFEIRDPIVVLIETRNPNGIFNLGTLTAVRDLSDRLARLPGVGPENVMSLATEKRDRVYPGTLNFRPFLDPLPEDAFWMDALKGDLDAADILTGTLVSRDRKATAIMVGAPSAFDGKRKGTDDRTELYRQIARTVAPYQSRETRISVAGAPAAESLLGTHILEDLTLLVPLLFLAVALACWWGCRRLAALMVALPKIGACIVWVFGVMGYLGTPVYLTTAVLPVVLLTASLADEIHLLWHYQQVLRERDASGHKAAVWRTVQEMARAIILVSLTTVAGLFSFLTSPIAPIRAFGLYAGLSLLFALLWTFTVVPATLALLPAERLERRGPAPTDGGRLRKWLGPLVLHRRRTLVGLGLVSVVLGLGVVRLRVQDSWVDGFAPHSPFRQATDRINRQLLGSHILLAHVTLKPPADRIPDAGTMSGPLLDPGILAGLGDFETFLRQRPEVGGVLGPASQLTTVSYLWQGRREDAKRLPDDPYRAARLVELFDDARGARRRREVIADGLDRAVVSIFLKEANYRDTARLMEAIRTYERAHLKPLWAKVDFAGDVAVSQAMIPQIVRSQVWSTITSLISCWLVIAWLHRSARLGLLAVIPGYVAVLWVFGIMGWFGIPLGVATSMFSGIALGIAVDYAIHYLERYRVAQDLGVDAPQLWALEDAGPAIVIDAIAIAVGFGILIASQVPANHRLGLLVAVALAASCILTLVGLGALLPSVERKPRAKTS